MNALAKLGMHASPSPVRSAIAYPTVVNTKDYFVERDGERFAGTHLLVDMWGAGKLADPHAIEQALCAAALAAGATVLYTHFHHFEPNGGVSGVVVLAESHISIHSWPERNYAAIDIFMCGECDPTDALPILREAFGPSRMEVAEHRRGVF
ncbi:MAG: adenosylmethionine decarboxylase [Proteobacteria bacterium]|nr:adenosylmethionine decarboxylase [Pseudomonadota bacterium]